MKLEFELDEQKIREQVVEVLAYRFADEDRLREHVSEAVRSVAKSRATALAEDLVRAEIVKVIEQGWPVTNTYGESSGKTVTISSIVREEFSKKRRFDGYNSPEETFAEKLVREAVKNELTSAFKDEIAAARARFVEAVDEVVKAKLAETLRKALGL